MEAGQIRRSAGVIVQMDGRTSGWPALSMSRAEFDELGRFWLHNVTPSFLISCIRGM